MQATVYTPNETLAGSIDFHEIECEGDIYLTRHSGMVYIFPFDLITDWHIDHEEGVVYIWIE